MNSAYVLRFAYRTNTGMLVCNRRRENDLTSKHSEREWEHEATNANRTDNRIAAHEPNIGRETERFGTMYSLTVLTYWVKRFKRTDVCILHCELSDNTTFPNQISFRVSYEYKFHHSTKSICKTSRIWTTARAILKQKEWIKFEKLSKFV